MSGGLTFLGHRAAVWLRRMRVMTAKELLQLSRDKALIIFFIYGFTAAIYLAGSGLNLELRHAALYVIDQDHSVSSRELIHRFREPYFRLMGELTSQAEASRLLDQGKAMLVLTIPSRFHEQILSGEPTAVQLQADTVNATIGFLASNYAAQIVSGFGQETTLSRPDVAIRDMSLAPVIDDRHRVWFNPNHIGEWFQPIEELANIITLFSILLPAAAMAREKERGTVEQLLVSPLTPFQIMFAKVAAMTLVILVGVAISVFFIIEGIFHLPIRGNLVLFFAMTGLYVFANSGLGMLIATLARNVAQVGLITILIMAPMVLLSGAWTPPEAMPTVLRYGMNASPLTHFLVISFGILGKGAGLRLLWDSILAMAFVGGIVFGVGMWRFRRQFG
ncbi:MAG: ABC transporter permease [Phycisphaerae bacterium]|nr:ABC transporter permease [Phycisphaerae bacterium]